MSGKGVVVECLTAVGNLKSYKEVVMDINHEREGRLKPKKPVMNSVQSEVVAKNPVEGTLNTAVSGYGGNGATVDQNKKGKNIPPQISAHIKPRHPLRFFPDVSPVSSRNLGKGITIQLNDKGQRCVVWNSKHKAHVGEQWVPREVLSLSLKWLRVGLRI